MGDEQAKGWCVGEVGEGGVGGYTYIYLHLFMCIYESACVGFITERTGAFTYSLLFKRGLECFS